MTEKQTTSSSFTERMKNTLGNIFPFTMGVGTGNEGESQKEEEDDEEQVQPRRMSHTSTEGLET